MPLLLAAGIVAVSVIVETPRERIVAVVNDMIRGVESGQIDRLTGYVDESYRGIGKTKAGVLRSCRGAVRRYHVHEVIVREMVVRVDASRRTAHMTIMMVVIAERQAPLHLVVDWADRGGAWRITSANHAGSSPRRPRVPRSAPAR